MKSWADYNSSDDENEDDFLAPENNPPIPEAPLSPVGDGAKAGPLTGDGDVGESSNKKGSQQRPKKEFVLPERPPFTAFVGNLAFSVKNPDELGQRIAELTMERFGKEINVTASRVAIDRRDGKHKGFGYVEVESLDHLKAVLELDDGQSMVAGRPIHLDVAQAQSYQRSGSEVSRGSFASRSSSFGTGEIDASKFQGGRHVNKKGDSFRRQGSSSSDIPQQRPSLKLQPRRKDRDDQPKGSPSSNIFGGAKPRDGETWERGRSSVKVPEKEAKGQPPQGENKERRSSRSGGRSGGRGDRGRGSMKNVRQSSNTSRGNVHNNKKEQNKKEESRKAPTTKTLVVKAPTEKTNKTETEPPKKPVINKFAALNFDDSDEE
mmetsp:Transcript_32719/g.48449  ORF Transcript_32719/g.48449 Transcript_32719/m.48449 type:complete len:377 (-) Transcript_32719:2471-3601(-)